MAPIATADGNPSYTTEPMLGNGVDGVNVALKLAAAEPEHGSSTAAPPLDGEAKHLQYPRSRVNLVDRFVDEPRKVKVAVVGGGLAGILAGCLLPQKVPGVELVIYEKNPDFVSCCPVPPFPLQSAFSFTSEGLAVACSLSFLIACLGQLLTDLGRDLARECVSWRSL